MDLIARYLDIEWASDGVSRRVEVSTYPIKIERAPDGLMHAEVSIFRNFAPWIGLHLSGDLAEVEPFTINAQHERVPWLRVSDKHCLTWWIPATGWSKANSRHVSEMHRSIGTFTVQLGPTQVLVVESVALELGRAQVQYYLDDFRDELVFLAIGQRSGASGNVKYSLNRAIVEALKEFTDAAGRVLEHPACDIREVTASTLLTKLRPSSETFRAVLRQPGARVYPGRVAQESANVPENRYLRSMVAHCWQLTQSIVRALGRHRGRIVARAARERERANELLAVDKIEVDPEVFDNQLSDVRRSIDVINRWNDATLTPRTADRIFNFSLGKEYKAEGRKEFYYRNVDIDATTNDDVSVVRLPDELHELVAAARTIDKNLTLSVTGEVNMTRFKTANGKEARRAQFSHISNVRANSPLLERNERARSRYEQEGWCRSIGNKEREEHRLEAGVALESATQLSEHAEVYALLLREFNEMVYALGRQDAGWDRLHVISSPKLPVGMRFVQNPIYVKALAAFQKLISLEQCAQIGGDFLENLGRINTLHASALYERWCLIKIIAILIQDFNFLPQGGWLETVIKSKLELLSEHGHSIIFTRTHPNMTACLEIEPVLANGRRPDFRLRFDLATGKRSLSTASYAPLRLIRSSLRNRQQQTTGIVMDAKFRTRWARGKLAAMLTLLVDTKIYGQDGDSVFILQPAKAAIASRTSPLIWGRDCDYGQDHPTAHSSGSIQLAADPNSDGASLINLRRLIGMELQKIFPEPEFNRDQAKRGNLTSDRLKADAEVCSSNDSFCINCGKSHETTDVKQSWTGGQNRKWSYNCANCRAETTRTHCFQCGTPLFKNGLQMTYHLTVADQISNVVCYNCGAGF